MHSKSSRKSAPPTVGFSTQIGSVGPNSVTIGFPNAAAIWRGPLSVETIRRHRLRHALLVGMPIRSSGGEKTLGCPASSTVLEAASRSLGPHRTSTSWSSSSAIRRARTAACSAGQIFAAPNAPLEFTTIDAVVCPQAQSLPQTRPRGFVFRGEGEFQTRRFRTASQFPGQLQIVVDDRHRRNSTSLSWRSDSVSKKRAPAVADVPDTLLRPAGPRQQGRMQRIRHQHDEVESFPTHPPDQFEPPVFPFAPRIKMPDRIEPFRLLQHGTQMGTHDTDRLRLRPEMATNRAQRGRRHHQIAEPIGEKEADSHGVLPGTDRPRRIDRGGRLTQFQTIATGRKAVGSTNNTRTNSLRQGGFCAPACLLRISLFCGMVGLFVVFRERLAIGRVADNDGRRRETTVGGRSPDQPTPRPSNPSKSEVNHVLVRYFPHRRGRHAVRNPGLRRPNSTPTIDTPITRPHLVMGWSPDHPTLRNASLGETRLRGDALPHPLQRRFYFCKNVHPGFDVEHHPRPLVGQAKSFGDRFLNLAQPTPS